MTQLELKMSALILGACEDLLPKTTARSNKSVIKALEAAREGGCKELAILHCVTGYPAPAGDYNLRTLVDMQ